MREIVGGQGLTTKSHDADAHEEGRWRGPMSDTSQRLLRRQPEAADTDWRDHAACRGADPELFFPIGTSGPALLQVDEAKQVCRACPVHRPCLRWALERGEDAGVWGGTTEDERRILRLAHAPL
jgi:WhiB family transcriptional regulator, redox-sensing transcriptional regulator